MKALKALVITMAVLIAAGLAVIAVTIFNRATTADRAPRQASSITGPNAAGPGRIEAPPRAFGAVRETLPPGARIVSTEAEGGRLIVTLALRSGATRIIVLDLDTGRRLGTIDLEPGK